MTRKSSIYRTRALVLMLCVCFLAAMSAGFTSAKAAGSKAGSGMVVSESEGGKLTDTFTILVGWKKDCPDMTQWQKVMSQKLNMNIKCQFIQSDDPVTAANLILASGGFADMAVFNTNETIKKAMVNSNLVQPVEKYLSSAQLPNLKKIPKKITNFITSPDKHIWYVPGWYAQEPNDPWAGWSANAWWTRDDILKKVGMKQSDLATISGVEKYLTAASKLKDASGNDIIPLGYAINDDGTNDNNVIMSAFGLDSSTGTSGMPGVEKQNGKFVFEYDNPKFKTAYQWINKMYRKKLLDIEVTTNKKERYREKVANGSYAMLAGSIWNADLNNVWATLNGPTAPAWYLKPVAVPKVPGITKTAASYFVSPYPGFTTFISKKTKHLNAIMNFLNWCNEASPIRQQEVSEGPIGTTWNWTNAKKPMSTWQFTPAYKADRDSGNQAKVDSCTPQLYGLSSYSSKWYPWWTESQAGNKKGAAFTLDYCQDIASKYKVSRTMHVYDAVTNTQGGVIEKNLALLNNVVKEYTAKMTMAGSDADFEQAYKSFKSQLETVAHWSDMKKEWNTNYQTLVTSGGEW